MHFVQHIVSATRCRLICHLNEEDMDMSQLILHGQISRYHSESNVNNSETLTGRYSEEKDIGTKRKY